VDFCFFNAFHWTLGGCLAENEEPEQTIEACPGSVK
jgi:hypothetical protein